MAGVSIATGVVAVDWTIAWTGQSLGPDGTATAPTYSYASNTGYGQYLAASGIQTVIAGASVLAIYGGDVRLSSTVSFGWSSGLANATAFDLALFRDGAAGTLGQRNGTSAQAYNLYNTYSGAGANYERLNIQWLSNEAIIYTSQLGTGVARVLKFGVAGAAQWVIDSSANFTAISSGTLGWAAGSGGAVAQATDKTTGVALNKTTGQITMQATALAANTPVSFTLTNTTIAANDIIYINHHSVGTGGAYTFNARPAAGSAVITVRNVTAGSLSEAIVLQFSVMKGAVA